MLAAPTDAEREVLGDIGWQRNEVVLHSDPRWLPERQRAWASWNYRLSDGDLARACVTYNMNILQGLPAGAPPVLRHPEPGRAGGRSLCLAALRL